MMNVGFRLVNAAPPRRNVGFGGRKTDKKEDLLGLKSGQKVTVGTRRHHLEKEKGIKGLWLSLVGKNGPQRIRRDTGEVIKVEEKSLGTDDGASIVFVEIKQKGPQGQDWGKSGVSILYDRDGKPLSQKGEYVEIPD